MKLILIFLFTITICCSCSNKHLFQWPINTEKFLNSTSELAKKEGITTDVSKRVPLENHNSGGAFMYTLNVGRFLGKDPTGRMEVYESMYYFMVDKDDHIVRLDCLINSQATTSNRFFQIAMFNLDSNKKINWQNIYTDSFKLAATASSASMNHPSFSDYEGSAKYARVTNNSSIFISFENPVSSSDKINQIWKTIVRYFSYLLIGGGLLIGVIGLGMFVGPPGPKKDGRFRTGYKNNELAIDGDNTGLIYLVAGIVSFIIGCIITS